MQKEETTHQIVDLDGSHGEGGGQVLRTALTLSMITGTPFRIQRIRARRSKPGLLRQHLTAVQAAQAVSGTLDACTDDDHIVMNRLRLNATRTESSRSERMLAAKGR